MRKAVSILSGLFVGLTVNAQVLLSTDFTNVTHKKQELQNIWTVVNRISPENGVNIAKGMELNVVRMIGGVNKKKNGKNVPNLEYDPCRYDSLTNTYVYNWKPLLSRIDNIRKDNIKILQLVLDQPSWAFQHGYTFIPKGTTDNIHFREDERVSIYGNSLPPADKKAYTDFIKAMMEKLVDTYGKSEVESWRLRIGSEIETPDHWRGTKQEFIDYFAYTEQAVRSVLPNAKIGIHTRPPDFLYRKGKELNYKSEPFASFAKDLIEYCYDHKVRYDFWGISDYVLINNAKSRNLSTKFEELFADLVHHPKWNKDAIIDVMEYSVVIGMAPPEPDGGNFLRCESAHSELMNIGFTNMFYKHDASNLQKIYRWGQREGAVDPPSIEILKTMEGKTRYETLITGKATIDNNQLDAIFAKSKKDHDYDVLVYNVNPSTLVDQKEELVTITFTTDLAVGTVLNCRNIVYSKEQNDLQTFLLDEPATGWVKPKWDKNGDPSRILNKDGKTAWAKFKNPNSYEFTDLKKVVTMPRKDGLKGSVVELTTTMPSYSFKKFEFSKK
ncbi:GH39 family glycosyl hydrolase [Flavobacterium faecale]|uniref:GH39 family glycosyl hydrolase n=1 Tax=Flavobacterium faecale TaxID=1355330 RepID=UPI003AB00465